MAIVLCSQGPCGYLQLKYWGYFQCRGMAFLIHSVFVNGIVGEHQLFASLHLHPDKYFICNYPY